MLVICTLVIVIIVYVYMLFMWKVKYSTYLIIHVKLCYEYIDLHFQYSNIIFISLLFTIIVYTCEFLC